MFYLHARAKKKKKKDKPQYVIQIIVIYRNNKLKCDLSVPFSSVKNYYNITIQKWYLTEISQGYLLQYDMHHIL